MEGVPGQHLKLVCRMRREAPSGERRKKQLWGKIPIMREEIGNYPVWLEVLSTEGDVTHLGNMEVPEKLS